jgi:hypothetical protein
MGRQALTSPLFEAENSEEKVSYWQNVFGSMVFLERFVRSTYCHGYFEDTNTCLAGLLTILINHRGLSSKT